LVDLNRAGTPLLEIVSEPDMHTPAESKAYTRELYLAMKHAGVSDCNLYYGNMRFDVNVSVSKTDELGTRTETKNINSFKAVEKTVEYEINRQIEELEKGGKIVQETRGWDDAKQKTFTQRTKENADDYRYMPDPDIPPVLLDDVFIEKVKSEMPISPAEWRTRLEALGLEISPVDTLLEAEVDDEDIDYLTYIEQKLKSPEVAKFLANWYVNVLIPLVREGKYKITEKDHSSIDLATYELIKANKLSSTNAKALYAEIVSNPNLPENIEAYAEEKGYIQVSDEGEIAKVVKQVLGDNAKAAEDVKNGEMKAIGFLIGQVMKASKGKANPSLAQQLIKKQLGL
jgi:aspartyl-tRNA(Asn)/glutamyl-tRNA(Gln) amidotransferase subunit B